MPSRPPPRCYTLMVLGGGAAAVAAADESARRGVRVALVLPTPGNAPAPDDHQPSEQTDFRRQIHRLQARFGQSGPPTPPADSAIDVYHGEPVLGRDRSVRVGQRELRFRKAIIATGRLPAAEVEGIRQGDCLRPDALETLTAVPPRVAVIGTGGRGCQWAQALRSLGSQVHLVGRQPTILPGEDPDAAGVVQDRMLRDGVRLHLGFDELAVETTGNLRGVLIGRAGRREKLLVEEVLLCGQRQPNTAGLGLQTVAVIHDDRGIVVNDRLQTTCRGVFAAGGVCGEEFATPQAAEATARLAVHNALKWIPRRLSRLVIPRCIYTDPQLARAGLTPQLAAERQVEIDTCRIELAEADTSIPRRRREGFIAVHFAHRSGRLVGATVVAEDADELLAALLPAITRRWSPAALADVVPCRPSRMELLGRLAERYLETRPRRFGVLQRCGRVPCPRLRGNAERVE